MSPHWSLKKDTRSCFALLRSCARSFHNAFCSLREKARKKPACKCSSLNSSLKELVKFPGFVTDVESVYAATDLFVFPSHHEPLACAMLSAMAYGLPVVAFDRGGNPEAIVDGKNGLLVKTLDPAALAAALARLVSRPEEAVRLGNDARETAINRFSEDRYGRGNHADV